MEIVRKDPYLGNTISTDLNNIATEISQTVKSSGISALKSTFEIFDASKMGIPPNASTLPAISNVADYVDPGTALARQVNSSLQPDISSQELLKIIKDPKFRAESELKSMKNDAGERFENAMNRADTEMVNGIAAMGDNIVFGKMNRINESKSFEASYGGIVESKDPLYDSTANILKNSVPQPENGPATADQLQGTSEARLVRDKYRSAMKTIQDLLDELRRLQNLLRS